MCVYVRMYMSEYVCVCVSLFQAVCVGMCVCIYGCVCAFVYIVYLFVRPIWLGLTDAVFQVSWFVLVPRLLLYS